MRNKIDTQTGCLITRRRDYKVTKSFRLSSILFLQVMWALLMCPIRTVNYVEFATTSFSKTLAMTSEWLETHRNI